MLQIDLIKYSSLPVLKKFLGDDEGLELKVRVKVRERTCTLILCNSVLAIRLTFAAF